MDAFILPPRLGPPPDPAAPADLRRWIAARHAEGATACSVCVGAFALAEAGLLDGRPATTHWGLAETFAARFPSVRLDAARMVIDDGDVVTAGGVMAWLDLGLRLIERRLGHAVMLDVARVFLVDPHGREQRFYAAFAPRMGHGDRAVRKVQEALARDPAAPTSIGSMADLAGLGERTFLRRFRKATGMTPTAYLQRLRVDRARELLETTPLPFARIAWEVGYADPAAFAKLFRREMGQSPGEHRRRFAAAP